MEEVKKASLIENEVEKEQTKQYPFATTQIYLPSKGKLYPVGHSLHNVDFIELKEMTAKEEDILTSKILLRKGIAIDRVVENCIIDKTIKQSDLLVGDRNMILLALRISGYGPEYTVETDCPICDTRQKHESLLTNMKMKTLDAEPLAEGVNEFEIELPKSGAKVIFKLLSVAEEAEITKTQENYRKMTGSDTDNVITSRMMKQIISVNGESNRQKISQFVINMPILDSKLFREYVKDIEPNVIMKDKITCKECGEVSEVDVPITVEFFWPSTIR